MSAATALRQRVGFAEQVAFPTYVVPTKFLELVPDGFKLGLDTKSIPQPVQNTASLRYYTNSKKKVAGAVEFYGPYQGMEMLLKHATGGAPTSTQIASTTVYTHTFPMAEMLPQYGLSIYYEPDQTALSQAYGFVGCQVAGLTLSLDAEKFLKAQVDFMGQTVGEQSSASTTYPTFKGIKWDEVTTLTINSVTYVVRTAEIKLENPLEEDRYGLGSTLMVGLGRKGPRKVSAKFTMELTNKAQFDLFRNGTEHAIVLECTGPIAANATAYRFNATLPRCVANGSQFKPSGHGIYTMDLSVDCYASADGTVDELQLAIDNLLSTIP